MFFGTDGRSSVTHRRLSRLGPELRAERAGRAGEDKALHIRGESRLEQIERPCDVGVDKGLLAVGCHMRLVQRRRVDHGGKAVHLRPDEGRIHDRAHGIGEGRGLHVDPARRRPAASEDAENGFAEMAGTAGDQDCHIGPMHRRAFEQQLASPGAG